MKLLVSFILTFIAGAVGSAFTFSEITSWYSTLNKPFFSPPNWVFGPVWTILYILMGISLYLFWKTKVNNKLKKVKKNGFVFFGIQLVLNSLWSILFFGLHNPGIAFLEIIFLWLSILLSIKYFQKVSKTSAYLLVPYILWVTFASLLNFAVWQLN